MNNKIHVRLGYKSYQIDSPDEEFTALMNQHFAQLQGEDSQVATLSLLQEYIKVVYDLRSARREIAALRRTQLSLIDKLDKIEKS